MHYELKTQGLCIVIASKQAQFIHSRVTFVCCANDNKVLVRGVYINICISTHRFTCSESNGFVCLFVCSYVFAGIVT